MSDREFKKALGVAEYTAKWVKRSNLVRLRAVGMLPCENYEADLEQRPERVSPPMWNMIFWVEDLCLRAQKKFQEDRFFIADLGTETVKVHDAAGEHDIVISGSTSDAEPITKYRTAVDEDSYKVFARVLSTDGPPTGCIILPSDSIVTAIYYCAFGPASHADCKKFLAENCTDPGEGMLRGGEIPWPLVV